MSSKKKRERNESKIRVGLFNNFMLIKEETKKKKRKIKLL